MKSHLSHCTAELCDLQRLFPQINTAQDSSRIANKMLVLLQGYIEVNQPSWNLTVISSAELCPSYAAFRIQHLCRAWHDAVMDMRVPEAWGKSDEQGVISLQFVHGLWLLNQWTWEFYIRTAQECVLAVVKWCLSCRSEGKQKQSGPFDAWKA